MFSRNLWAVAVLFVVSSTAFGQKVTMDSQSSVTYTQLDSLPHLNENLRTNVGAQTLVPTTISSTETFGPGSASGFVVGSMGVLHAYATAAYPLDTNFADGNTSLSQSTVRDDDSLVVTSSTLATGTAVTLDFSYTMDGAINADVSNQGGAIQALADASLNINPLVGSATNLDFQTVTSANHVLFAQVATTVGATINFNYSLSAYAQIYAYSPIYHSITCDFSNTAMLTIASENSAASISTASGYNYAPAPEPSEVCALGLGVALLLRKRFTAR